jgi:oligosaccharide repeat unit polymerase
MPVIVGESHLLVGYPAMNDWLSLYDLIPKKSIVDYIAIIFMYFVSFSLGAFIPHRKTAHLDINASKSNVFNLLGSPFLFLVIILTYMNRDLLFSGYADYNATLLAVVATANVISIFLLLYSLLSARKPPKSRIIPFCTIIISSVFLLSLGSRMYVLIPIIAVLIFKLKFARHRWGIFKLVLVATCVLVSILLIGAWRLGGTVSADFYIYLFLAEPIFTWWSTASFLSTYSLDLFSLPANYISSIINFFPSFLLPDKADFIVNIRDSHQFASPLGALSIFVAAQINFGVIFSFIFFFLLGFYYSIMERNAKYSIFYRSYYILICAILPFQLFRDGFEIFNKQLFWNMFTVPAVLYFMSVILLKILPVKNMRRGV